MHGSLPPHHYILGSVSTFQSDDFFVLKHLCMYPLNHTNISFIQFSIFKHNDFFLYLNIYAWVPLHHTTISLVQFSTFKHDDFFVLKYLCMGPLPTHQCILHSSVMTLLYLNIYAWATSTTPLYSCFSFCIQAWWHFCTHLCAGPFTPTLYPWFSFSIQMWWTFCFKNTYVWVPAPHQCITGSVSTTPIKTW